MNWKNPDEVRTYHREYRRRNAAKCSEWTRKYRESNPEKAREQHRKAYLKRRESGKYEISFRKWYQKNADRIRAKARIETRERKYRKLFGIGYADKERMFQSQGGLCAICGSAISLSRSHLDHDHSSMKVRALLCNLCNMLLGGARDNTGILSSAIEYLNRFQAECKTNRI